MYKFTLFSRNFDTRKKPDIQYFTSLCHQMTSLCQHFYWSGKHWSRAFIWYTIRYGFCNFKIWPWGTLYFTLALTMKVICDRHPKLLRYKTYYMLLSHQDWRWSNKKYSKNKAFISIMTWLNLDLSLWPWPYYLIWWLLTP
jgi:hypothetical protein